MLAIEEKEEIMTAGMIGEGVKEESVGMTEEVAEAAVVTKGVLVAVTEEEVVEGRVKKVNS